MSALVMAEILCVFGYLLDDSKACWIEFLLGVLTGLFLASSIAAGM